MTLFAKVMELLKAQGADDVVVMGGGIIPEDDIAELKALGVAEVFTPGATTRDIVGWLTEHVSAASAGPS
jgi:methylmalonyl-CoA mutase C-terminal domain/subunit